MNHSIRPLGLLLSGTLFATGCATAHLAGQYTPQSVSPNATREVTNKTEKQNLAEGSDWVLFWGLVEAASSDLADEAKRNLRQDEAILDPEVRNHLSLPGALLWIVTAGIVSHHDLVLSGRVGTLKIAEPPKPEPAAAVPIERRIVVTKEPYVASESELFSETEIDKPIRDVAMNFNEQATRAGLIPLSQVRWDSLSSGRKRETQGEIPQNRLEGVDDSKIHTFLVTTDRFADDVRRDPKCGAFTPSIVCYEKDGKTHVFYSRPSGKLREMDANGRVGDGKMMTRSQYEDHQNAAREYEVRCESLVRELASKEHKAEKAP
ncbi:MAG: hypothetical protein ACAI25_17420 [Planctomycetota bacterium]